ncbi:GntR family transcriptional regulator [Mycolicibacterium pulveris]|uniref:GntR family transcriptional regulator n=1 Tax=Mycolicibacterium pulveris TaxID=36813 RepID=UPI003CF35999
MTADASTRMELLRRTPRLVDEVINRLRESIVDGTLPAGTPLPQVALAAQLGVSRTPLREALRVLDSEGLVRRSDGNRTVEVVQISPDELREMYELREVIDGLAARLAARNGLAGQDVERGRHLLAEMADSSDPYDPVRRNRAHAEFHELFALASGNARVQSFSSLIRTSSAMLYLPLVRETAAANLTAANPNNTYKEILDQAQAQHKSILEAVVARKPEAAEQEARRHIQRTLRLAPYFG